MSFNTLFSTIRSGWIFVALIALFTGCSDNNESVDLGISSASLAATTVNCNTTSNQIITIGPAGIPFTATISFREEDQTWCSFGSNTSSANGSVGQMLPLVLEKNSTDSYRVAEISVTFSNGYSTTLKMWQMPASGTTAAADFDRAWGEQPAYRQGSNYIYKTYHTTLVSSNKYLVGGQRRNYSICYDAANRISLWVAYPLHGCYTSPNTGRSDTWAYDPNRQLPVIAQNQQPYIIKSYGSGDARGHQCPSADRYNTTATNEMTFYATNIMPQNYDFNSGSWVDLEGSIRSWAPTSVTTMRYDTLFVVTGVHLSGRTITDREGNRVGYPDKCWKVLLKQRRGLNENRQIWEFSADELQAIGFIFTNDEAGGEMKLRDAACPVADVEALTGFTFFQNLDPAVADEVKRAEPDTSLWPGLATK